VIIGKAGFYQIRMPRIGHVADLRDICIFERFEYLCRPSYGCQLFFLRRRHERSVAVGKYHAKLRSSSIIRFAATVQYQTYSTTVQTQQAIWQASKQTA
jgi:hypothetical protein